MRIFVVLVCFISVVSSAQSITSAQQKKLNDCVAYANQSAEEVTAVVKSIIDYYPNIHQKSSYYRISYTCPVQLDDYYYNQAINSGKLLGPIAVSLNEKLKLLRSAAEKIDIKCKALDTYHKLEDYKQDNFAKAETLIQEIQQSVKEYGIQQKSFADELASVYKKLNKYTEANAYYKTDLIFKQQLDRERAFLDTWTFNINEQIHSGWSVETLEQSIQETDKQSKLLASFNPTLKYPASSMLGSFKESLGSILESKRRGLDEYNFEAKKSDKHSNDVYMNLINYYNGALLADYNAFIGFASADNYYGINTIKYVPLFEIRTKEESVDVSVKPFQDITRSDLIVTPQKTSLTKTTFASLNLYVDFINEGLRQVDYLQQNLRNLNSSAKYYKDLTSYKGKGGLQYDYDNFQLPLSLFQQAIGESTNIPVAYRKSLTDQAGVLLAILKEMDQWSASLEIETKEKRYEKDNLKKLFEALERNKVLFQAFDTKKEQLYNDVRRVYESYPVSDPANSWSVSGKALQKLIDLDHDGLFKAKAYYNGDASVKISTADIDETLRNVIANEYTNLKGIEKIGRNNGNCPYTPYEDLPMSSKTLSEKLNKLKPATASYGYSHPYHEMVYQYNDAVDDLNKFSELSKTILLLKSIKQPELFEVTYEEKKKDNPTQSDIAKQENAIPPVAAGVTPEKKGNEISDVNAARNSNNVSANNTKVLHDTVYIEKRDTIYIGEPGEDLHSMEGYASNNMILLLDVSGSMNAPEKLPLLKTSVLNLLKMMRSEDEVSIITYSGKANVLLKPTSFKDEEQIKKVIEKLKSQGKTDGNAGLKMAYKVADENYIRGGNNRIILATDGEFPISAETLALVEKFSKEDIFISVFNFGKSNTSGKSLEKLAATGKGNYEYITQGNVELKLIREVKAKRKK
ncbi:MAG TPA: VWA domain-containing protein [Cyclobacteriaceae bacterium]|jgi:Mg-chelatase subunit ChlD|nr:VWA domain-containing protein [Cyclobacteriaceae bacterium]